MKSHDMTKNMTKDMTTGSPARLLFFFSLPLMFGNVFQQLYTVVDTISYSNCAGRLQFFGRESGLRNVGQ